MNLKPLPLMLTTVWRFYAIGAITLITVIVGVIAGLSAFKAQSESITLQILAGKAIFASLPTLLVATTAYSIIWHVKRLRG